MGNNRIITPGELSPGQFITAYDIKRDDDAAYTYNDEPMVFHQAPPLDGYKGALFEVIDIDLPYVAVRGVATNNRSIIDSRLFILMEVRKEFVQRLLSAQPPPPPETNGATAARPAFDPWQIPAIRAVAQKLEERNLALDVRAKTLRWLSLALIAALTGSLLLFIRLLLINKNL